MKTFDYVRPATVADAVAAAARPGAAYLASGTNLLDLMKVGVARPDRLIDITHICRARPHRAAGRRRLAHRRAGAQCRSCPRRRPSPRSYPAVAEALLSGASAQLRNAATVGGNLLQRTRCAYFQDPASACNRREPGSGCDALQGENRLHAVLGWSPSCIAVHPSDFCVPLVALDAVVEIEGRSGRREIALEALHRLPGDAPERETALEPGDLITAVRLPAAGRRLRRPRALSQAARAHVLCLRRRLRRRGARHGERHDQRRHAWRWAASRPSPGAPAPPSRAWPAPTADAAAFRRAAEAALADARPSGDNAFKIELARRIIVRALRWPPQGRRSACRPCPARPSLPFPERAMTLETTPHLRHGSSIGQPLTRRDGVLKVTGKARFAADNHPPGMLYAVVAISSIARGRVTSLNVAAAKGHKGVVEVMTPANRPALAQDPDEKTNPFMFRLDLLQNDRVRYANQPIAVVIAESLEAATEGAALLAAALRSRAGARRPRRQRKLRAARRRHRHRPPKAARATSKRASRRPPRRSTRPTRRRRNITMRWSRTPSWWRGTAMPCRSTCRARAWRWRAAASPGCSAWRRRRSTSAAPSSAAASARRA